ncbi:MAG: sortase [Pseudomonadota bacterium]
MGLALSVAALLGGLGLAASALWIPAKAALGHYLIASAYQQAKASPAATGGGAESAVARPWSWADWRPMARLRFPSLGGAERYVLDQASGEAMAWGAGWIRGSAPLGAAGLSGVAAHRDTHFALLKGLEPGDVIELETLSGVAARYRMIRGEVVDSRSWRLPLIHAGPDALALSTCWPFGAETIGPMRYVVFALRIEEADAA